jgi:hypoxanthine phosphoribosyltransferase
MPPPALTPGVRYCVPGIAWTAPPRFLVGYGMDAGGKMRGLPFIGAVD